MTLTFHAHPLSSYCWKALIALYENDTPFDYCQLDPMDPEAHAAFVALWPLAKMPVLVDDGRIVAEASIIIEHLALHHPGPVRLLPEDPADALEVRMLDRIFDNYVMTPMQRIVFERFRGDGHRDPGAVQSAHALIDTSRAFLEDRLAGRTWAAGEDFSLADCAAAPSLHYAEKVNPMDGRYPVLAAYLARLEARPSFARVLKEAEPYAHMFPSGD
jgi:glutathione S-transferase